MTEPVVVFDFETTGLSARNGDRPTEIAAVVLEGDQVVDTFQSLMNPERPIPNYVQSLTGITDRMVRSAPPVPEVVQQFADFISSYTLVAHNASFDRQFLDWEFSNLGISRDQSILCSMRIARRVYPNCPNHKLGTLVEFANIPMTGSYHRALADAEVTAKLWVELKSEIMRRCQIDTVPVALLEKIQSVPCHGLSDCVQKYLKSCGGVAQRVQYS